MASRILWPTVRTILRILEGKGEVKHRVQDRSFVYRPTRARKQVARSAMTRLVDVFYEGSVTQTMNGLLQLRDAKLNDDEWEELSGLIAQARTQQQEDTP